MLRNILLKLAFIRVLFISVHWYNKIMHKENVLDNWNSFCFIDMALSFLIYILDNVEVIAEKRKLSSSIQDFSRKRSEENYTQPKFNNR